MADGERMGIDERRKYLRLLAPRYAKAGRVERSGLLTEMEALTGLHRKRVLRLLHGSMLERAVRRPMSRRSRYKAAMQDVVRVVWETCDYACAERLTPELLQLALSPEVEEAPGRISRSTVQRLLRRFRRDSPQLPRRRQRAGNVLLREILMERLSWGMDCPGTLPRHRHQPVTFLNE